MNDIFPDEFLQRLDAAAERHSKSKFEIGNLAIEGITKLRQAKHDIITQKRPWNDKVMGKSIAELQSWLGGRFGIKARRLRDYIAVCIFYDSKIIDRFDKLYFAHFEFAMQYPDHAIAILELADKKLGNLGRPPSVAWMEANFRSELRIRETIEQLNHVLDQENIMIGFDPAADVSDYTETIICVRVSDDESDKDNKPVPPVIWFLLSQLKRLYDYSHNEHAIALITDAELQSILDEILDQMDTFIQLANIKYNLTQNMTSDMM